MDVNFHQMLSRSGMGYKWLYALILCWVASVTVGVAQHRVEVVVTGVRDTTGTIMVALFTSSETFLKKPAVGKKVKASKGEVIVVFEGQPEGEYAGSIIHDTNRNGKLDTNFMGIPREGFGFSNDVMGTFGPPAFGKAKFKVTSSSAIRIKIRYL